jgi:glycosyltransferase involved in cell wall biosynthesis
MKLAFVVPGGVDRSGEYRVVPALLAQIERAARRHELHVFALAQEPQPGSWPLAGATVHNIGDARSIWRLMATIRAEHRRAPFQLVHAFWSGNSGLGAVLAARWLGVPCLVHVAGGELVALHDIRYGGRRTLPGRMRERFVLRSASRVSAASTPILEQIRILGVCGQRVPLGVDLARWPPVPPRPRAANEPPRLIHVASLNAVKDQGTLLKALHALRSGGVPATLDICGEDTLDGAVQRHARQLGLSPCVRFLGFRTQAQLRPLMQDAHVHVVSSRHEAGPMVMLEAAILGVPTVGTAVGHLVEWSPHAARAVAPGDAPGLALALADLLGDETLRLRLAGEAQRRATLEDADFTASCFEESYRSLLDMTRR